MRHVDRLGYDFGAIGGGLPADEISQRQAHAPDSAARKEHARPREPASRVAHGKQTPKQRRQHKPRKNVQNRVDVNDPRRPAQREHIRESWCKNAPRAIGRTVQRPRQFRRPERRMVGNLRVVETVVATVAVHEHRVRLERFDLSFVVRRVEHDERGEPEHRMPKLGNESEEEDDGRRAGTPDESTRVLRMRADSGILARHEGRLLKAEGLRQHIRERHTNLGCRSLTKTCFDRLAHANDGFSLRVGIFLVSRTPRAFAPSITRRLEKCFGLKKAGVRQASGEALSPQKLSVVVPVERFASRIGRRGQR